METKYSNQKSPLRDRAQETIDKLIASGCNYTVISDAEYDAINEDLGEKMRKANDKYSQMSLESELAVAKLVLR